MSRKKPEPDTTTADQRYRMWLWGAVAERRGDGSVQPPANPYLLKEFEDGRNDVRNGTLNLTLDFNPDQFIARRKADRKLKLEALAAGECR